MAGLHDLIVERAPFDTGGGKSGAKLERVTLDDGREFILKHESGADLLSQAVHGQDRIGVLWESGLLARVPRVLDPAIAAVEREPSGDGWLLFMPDVSDALIPEGGAIDAADHERTVAATTALHNEFLGEHHDGLCGLADRVLLLAPETMAPFRNRGDFLPPVVLRGWELFPEAVPTDIADAIWATHAHAGTLADRLAQHECTLLHGDFRLANLGLADDHVVLIDWGALSAIGPSALEWTESLAIDVQCIEGGHDAFAERVRIAEGARYDPDAWRLALLAAFAMHAWNKALDLLDNDDEAIRARQRIDLDWWIAQVRDALELWSPT